MEIMEDGSFLPEDCTVSPPKITTASCTRIFDDFDDIWICVGFHVRHREDLREIDKLPDILMIFIYPFMKQVANPLDSGHFWSRW